MTDELEKNLEESSFDAVEVLSTHLPGRIEENHLKLQPG
jgi:hypothetical protein